MSTPGRNDPCPCGSGKPYQQCCMQQATVNPPVDQSAQGSLNRAIALHRGGQLAQAEQAYRKTMSLDPKLAVAHMNLGLILEQRGAFEEAAQSYAVLAALAPGNADAHFNLANMHKKLGRLEDAIAGYRRALSLNPADAEAHFNLGNALQDAGEPGEAERSYRDAIRCNPAYSDAYNNLGNLLQKQARFVEAVSSYQDALRLNSNNAQAWRNLGGCLRNLGRFDEALVLLHQAMDRLPRHAGILVSLAAVHADMGRFDEARAVLSDALSAEPGNAAAWAALAGLGKMTQADHDWIDEALRLMADPAISMEDKLLLAFATGKYYDDTGQYDRAFDAYFQANAIARRMVGKFDRAGFSRLVDAMIAYGDAETIRQPLPGASDSHLPVLVIGMPRSGTSLVEQIIASHPQAFGAGELPFWGDWLVANEKTVFSGGAIEAAEVAATYAGLLRQYSSDAQRIVDKMPGNFVLAGLIHQVFPNAKIIHVRRHPVDTCLSIYFQNLTASHPYANDLHDLAFYYREYERLMQHWRTVMPADSLMEVRYESLVEEQEEWSRRIIDFIGLEWDARCLDFHATERTVATASNWQVRQKIYQTSKARWMKYASRLGPLRELIQP